MQSISSDLPKDVEPIARRGRFPKSLSGNPKGRPQSSRNRSTLALEAMLEGEVGAITRQAIEMAKEGNKLALVLCMERLVPVRREQSMRVELPELAGATSNSERLEAIMVAVADAPLGPSEGEALANLIEAKVEADELDDIRRRLWTHEQKDRESHV